MKSKSFADRILLVSVVAVTLVVTSPAQNFAAPQEPPAEPASAAPMMEEPTAFVRTWFMTDPRGTAHDVVARQDTAPEPQFLLSRPYAYQYVGYRDLPPGRTRITVQVPGEPPRVLEQWEGNLAKGRFYTILIRARGAGLALEVIDDSKTAPPPEKPQPGAPPPPVLRRLFLYQFIEGQTVTLSVPELGWERQLPPGTVDRIEDLPAGTVNLLLTFKDAQGESRTSETDISTADTPSCSLILIRDLYGRVSPRVVANGRLD